MSVSDVVKITWNDFYDKENNMYLYCDSIDWMEFEGFEKETKLEQAKVLWEMLGDVCIDEDECIDDDWLCFKKGTHREEIWYWFEDTFDVSVATDLFGFEL